MGTTLCYSTAYHPQTQGIVERMNSVIGQMIRFILHEMNDVKNWLKFLPTVELAINSVPNRSTDYTAFFLNYGYDVIVLADLVSGDETIRQVSVGQFRSRLKQTWDVAVKRMK